MAPHSRGFSGGHQRDDRRGAGGAGAWLSLLELSLAPYQKARMQEGRPSLLLYVSLLSWLLLVTAIVILGVSVSHGRDTELQLARNERPAASSGGSHSSSYMSCHQRLRDGRCVSDVLRQYHLAHADRWPAQVDLIVRTHHSTSMFLLATMLRSTELFWPVGIAGDVIVVLDDTPDDRLHAHTLPPWVKVVFSAGGPAALPGYLVQQHSLFWSDNYTAAPFLAIADDDMVFTTPVTPELLFDGGGRPFVIASDALQRRREYVGPTEFFLGPGSFKVNAMVALPNVYPTRTLRALRAHVAARHAPADFDGAFVQYCTSPRASNQIGQFLMGNYLYSHARDQVHFMIMESGETPAVRVAEHVAYSMELIGRVGGRNYQPREHKLSAPYLAAANACVQRGLCDCFPPGELGGNCSAPDLMARGPWSYYVWTRHWAAFGDTRATESLNALQPPPPPGSLANIPNATERLRRHLCGLWQLYFQTQRGSSTGTSVGSGPPAAKLAVGAGNVDCSLPALPLT